jgi:hypothetical protein
MVTPIIPELRKIIDASPCGKLTYLVTEYGKPFTAKGFGVRFRNWCNEAGLKTLLCPWSAESSGYKCC